MTELLEFVPESGARSKSSMKGHHFMKYPLARLLFVCLFSVASGSVAVWAQVKDVPPIPGVIGKVEAVTSNSVEIQTKSGVVHVEIEHQLTTYRQVPSNLSHVTTNSYVGIVSVKQEDGKEVAKSITIFPPELRGAAEGSVLMDAAPGETRHNRMTNGSVSRPVSNSRMTNGTVLKGDPNAVPASAKGPGTTLVVRYQDGAQAISVPPNATVTDVAPEKVTLGAGDTIYAATTEQPNGTLTTNKILLIAVATPRN